MPLTQHVVHGYEQLREEIDRWTAKHKAHNGDRLVLLILSNHVDGKGWCPDCVAAEPLVNDALQDETVTALDTVFITAFVDSRDSWKDQSNLFRTSPDLLITSIPTLLEYGKLERRLGDKDFANVETIKSFILGQ